MRVHFPESDKYLFAKVSGTHAFGRVDVEGPFYYCDSDGRTMCSYTSS